GAMRNQPSRTAEIVAFARSIAKKLPRDAQLADDPYGALFAGPAASLFAERSPSVFTIPLWPLTLYMQVRTRAIDDVLRGFLDGGGRQVMILGAGYDCRAARFAAELAGARLYEVDHSATQARKRAILDQHGVDAAASYLPFDFETRPLAELPSALAAIGHDA